MPNFPSAGPFQDQRPLVGAGGIVTPDQAQWFLLLAGQIAAMQTVINNNLGTNFFALASQPSLGAGDVGYVGYVTDYAHLVYWDGSAWQWLDGDRPGRFSGYSADPGTGWGVCDGSTYTLLVVGGATLTTSSFTTPDLAGTPAYLKSDASYTGTINAASGSTSTAGAHDHTGATGSTAPGASYIGNGADIQQGTGTTTGVFLDTGVNATRVDVDAHTHTISTDGSHSHTIGTLDMPNLAVLVYVRR